MLTFTFRTLIFAAVVTLFTACGDDGKDPLTIPLVYDDAQFVANTGVETNAKNNLAALTTEMKKGRVNGVVLDFTTLHDLFVTGSSSPALYSITTPYYRSRIDGVGNWLDQLALASGGTYTPGDTTGEGGTFGGYLFDEYGVEYEQLVEKGLFGAALYHHAIGLMNKETLTPADVDRLLASFGAQPSFTNSDNATLHGDQADRFLAAYGARRDPNDGNGLYSQMRRWFLQLQAAVAAGSGYQDEQDEALAGIIATWEKINAATVVNYCYTATDRLSATNPTEADQGSALHALGEAIGFLDGWRTLPDAYRLITDNEIVEILALLNVPATGNPAVYRFATAPASELPKLLQAVSRLKTIYGFSDAELEGFRKNWVNEQGR